MKMFSNLDDALNAGYEIYGHSDRVCVVRKQTIDGSHDVALVILPNARWGQIQAAQLDLMPLDSDLEI
jgi:hypothetical protein